MKKIPLFVVIGLLTGCMDSGSDVSLPLHNGPRDPIPQFPTTPFEDPVEQENKTITGMYSRTQAQVDNYIDYRLQGYDTSVENYQDLIDLALWLTDGQQSQADIEAKYNANKELMNQAMYVVHKSLKYCAGDNAAAVAQCFISWRDSTKGFDSIGQVLRDNTQVLTADNATFNTLDDVQLKFSIADGSDSADAGEIDSITIVTDGEPVEYNRLAGNMFTHFDKNTEEPTINILTYNSAGKKLGLSYSDFGSYNIDNQTMDNVKRAVAYNVMFAGGYDSKKIETKNIAENMTFRGDAVGTVSKGDKNIILSGGQAYLNFDKDAGTSTLNADFSNWYDVRVDNTGAIEFSQYKSNANGYDMHVSEEMATGADFHVNYYGPTPENGIPTEATGLVHYEESVADGIKLDMAFGVKK